MYLLRIKLALCLSTVLPNSVRILALEVYAKIFEKLNTPINKKRKLWRNYIGSMSPGLFIYYQFAKEEEKLLFLKIIKTHYLNMGKEIVHTLNGLIGCLLTGLDEQNQGIIRMTQEIFEELEKKVGTRMFMGVLWQMVLTVPKIRTVTLKFMLKFIPTLGIEKLAYEHEDFIIPTSSPEEFKELTTEAVMINSIETLKKMYYVSIDTLVFNAIIASMKDNSIFTQRAVLDFLIKHIPLKSSLIDNEMKVELAVTACCIFRHSDSSITRRLDVWLFEDKSLIDIYPKIVTNLLQQSDKDILPIAIEIINHNEQNAITLYAELCVSILLAISKSCNEKTKEVVKNFFFNNKKRKKVLWKRIKKALIDGEYNIVNLVDAIKVLLHFSEVVKKKVILELLFDALYASNNYSASTSILKLIGKLLPDTKLEDSHIEGFVDHYKTVYLKQIIEKRGEVPEEYREVFVLTLNIGLAIDKKQIAEITVDSMKDIKSNIMLMAIIEEIIKFLKPNTEDTIKKLLMEKLWESLLHADTNKRAIKLFLMAKESCNEELSEAIYQSLHRDTYGKVEAINVFSNLWINTQELSAKHELFNTNSKCVLQMIEFLIDPHHMIRHASHFWFKSLYRLTPVFDTIFRQLLQYDDNPILSTDAYTLIEGDTEKILHLLKQLRNIVFTNKDRTFLFFKNTKIPEEFMTLYMNHCLVKGYIEKYPIYFTLALFLLVKIIRSFSFVSNFEINVYAITLLKDFLIEFIKEPDLLSASELIIDPIFKYWMHSTANEIHILQLELLGLIKEIQMLSWGTKGVSILYKFLGHPNYFSTLKAGLISELSYIREAYLDYIVEIMPRFYRALKKNLKFEVFVHQIIATLEKLLFKYLNADPHAFVKVLVTLREIVCFLVGITDPDKSKAKSLILKNLKFFIWNLSQCWKDCNSNHIKKEMRNMLQAIALYDPCTI